MSSFIDAAQAFPTAIYTVLLGVVLVYWVLAMLGMVDFESSGVELDLDLQTDGDAGDIGTLAGYVVAFGLNGVPFSIVVSLIVLIAWTVSCTLGMWVLSWVPTALLRALAGAAVLGGSFVVAIPLTARIVRPMRALFVHHAAVANAALVGQPCKVLTQSVDERHGRAEVMRRGASINIRVWARSPNSFQRGMVARIVEYDEAAARYRIEPSPEADP